MTDWWDLIDKRAALSEQFPTLAKVRNERPGCKADQQRQTAYREASRIARERHEKALWEASVAENARRREVNNQRTANAAYKKRNAA